MSISSQPQTVKSFNEIWYNGKRQLHPSGADAEILLDNYRKISNISHTKFSNLNVSLSSYSCLSAPYYSQVLSREWSCNWSSACRRCSNYIWVIIIFIANYGVTYIRGLAVGQYHCFIWLGSLRYWVINNHWLRMIMIKLHAFPILILHQRGPLYLTWINVNHRMENNYIHYNI